MSATHRTLLPVGPSASEGADSAGAEGEDAPWLLAAIDSLGGGALVLNDALRVVGATAGAERALGVRVPYGAHAVRLLCGDTAGPVAEALAAGRPVATTIPRLRPDAAGRMVRLRATPLRAAGRRAGWLLLLAEDKPAADVQPEEFHGLWTRDPTLKRLFRLAEKVASCDASVLIEGEMGTGKATLAAAIHSLSPRRQGPFRAVNCAAATPAVLERQLFGRPGATQPGHVRLADRGTLFLDNVEELPPEAQAELLRALESGVLTPLDGGEPTPVDVRVVAATHSSLSHEVELGRFRADLMYRLRSVSLHLPPLRARRADVPLLVERFVAELNARGGRVVERVAPNALDLLAQYDWPGNVRELRAALESAYATGEGPVLLLGELPPEIAGPEPEPDEARARPSAPPAALAPANDADEAARIRRALARAAGDRTRAAAMLGMSRTTLWRRMRALGLLAPGGNDRAG